MRDLPVSKLVCRSVMTGAGIGLLIIAAFIMRTALAVTHAGHWGLVRDFLGITLRKARQ